MTISKKFYTDRDELKAATMKGRLEEKIAIARNLLAQHIDASTVSGATGLSVQEVEELIND